MDSVIKVRRSFLNDIRAFCNMFAGMCDGCFKRPCNCPNVDVINRAKNLIFRIDNIRDAEEERFFVENPTEDLLNKVESAIRQGGGRPVRSENIRIDGETRQRKARALKTLVKRRRIVRTEVDGTRFYTIPMDGLNETQQQHKKGN